MSQESIAILPLGATEQHGRHLPAETDWIIAEALADRLVSNLPPGVAAFVLPVEKIGYSPEHLGYPGTISLGYEEAAQRWIGIGEGLAAQGCRKLLLLNAHGGNSPVLSIVATELRCRANMLCVVTSWSRFGVPEGLFDQEEIAIGIHGGAVETSIMLALRPDLVDERAFASHPSLQSELARDCVFLRAYGKHAFGWKMRDLNPGGVVGNASAASSDKGERLIAHCLSGLRRLLTEMARFDLGRFGE